MRFLLRPLCPLALIVAALLLSPRRGVADDAPANRAQAILKTHCHRCHGQDGTARGGFAYVLDRDRLVARGKIVPGRPDDSELFQRVRDGEMPPAKQQPRPSAEEVAALRQWIEAGAPPVTPPPGPRTFLAGEDVLRLLLADVQTIEPRERRFIRYLSLTHLYNAGVPEEDLQTCRQSLAKLVNSLSWHPRITLPQPIDPARTLWRLDLRHYQWNARLWDRLASVYPYRVPDSQEARALAAATGCELPCVRGDWFVAVVSRPPLYHDFLQLPASDRELERLLRVDVLTNWQEENVVRAGFNGSGVSRNNRLIERHDAAFGAYWRSYDFADNTDRQNLFEHPLGPLPGQNSFQHAGGELIFHLPNGLQGYLLVDSTGRRLDRAPVAIVSDPGRPDRSVEAGLSCLTCHSRGLLPLTDQVRAHVLHNPTGFTLAEIAAVKALYPPAAVLRSLMQEDSERFLKALARTGVQPGDPEPIAAVAQRYEAPLDLAGAAAEAGLTPDDFSRRLRDVPALNRTLGVLLTRGGTVQRSVFEASFGELRPPASSTTPATVVLPTPVLAPFTGHAGYIGTLAFSPDGRRALSGSEDGTVRLWDVATGKEVRRFNGPTEEVLSVAFSAGGSRVVSGGRDRTIRVWEIETGKELPHGDGHTDRVSSVALTADGRRVLSGSWDGTVRLWDADTGKELLRLTGHTDRVTTVALSPDGRHALSGGRDGTVRLWDLQTGQEVRRLAGHVREVTALAVSADGRRALSGGVDRTVCLWDLETGQELHRLGSLAGSVVAVAFTAEGHRALVGSSQYQGSEQPFRLWDLDSGKEPRRLGSGRVWSVAFAPAGDLAVTATSEKTLRLWKLDSNP